MKKYKVKVTDSLSQDGIYITNANTKRQAINKVTEENNIQISQSWTYFRAIEII